MTARPRRTTTLAGPNRIVLGSATAGLVALASAGTALLVLTGTSAVAPTAAPAPPLPSTAPPARAPGVVVLPTDDGDRIVGGSARAGRAAERRPALPGPAALPKPSVPTPAAPRVVVDVHPPTGPAPTPPALRPAPEPTDATADRPGRRLAKGHAKQRQPAKRPKLRGKRVGWSHSNHFGNR